MSVQNTHFGAERIGEILHCCKKVFFIGIGGVSVSSLAYLTRRAGFFAGGSDRVRSAVTDALEKAGIAVFLGHDAAHLEGYDAVVYTTAIGEDNPEYLAACKKGLPLISRADYLGYLMTGYRTRVGIAGMHGKSTCTAMCARIFEAWGDPTVLCGAPLPEADGACYRVGEAREHFIFEACEYMDSFLDFSPTLAVVLNIAMDHVDYFHSMEQIHASFLAYARRTGRDETVLYNADDPESLQAFADFEGRKVTFGIEQKADYSAQKIGSDAEGTFFELWQGERRLCDIRLRVHGRHAVYNALAASAAAILSGVSPEAIQRGLAAFTGAGRRMEYKGVLNGAAVYDDYAHHPDEIAATLAGAREMGARRILCAYQPHTYSRTVGLLEAFAGAFGNADRVYFADIYAAREENPLGVSSAWIAERMDARATYCGGLENLAEALKRDAREGDLVIVMGAGDIFKVFEMLGL